MPWTEQLDADTLAHVTSKGWEKLDDAQAPVALATAYRNLEKLHGSVAAGQMVNLPDASSSDPAVRAAFWSKLGAASQPEAYKFDDVKFTTGEGLPSDFQETVRKAALRLNMPVPMVQEFMKDLVPQLEAEKLKDATSKEAASVANRAALDQEWGSSTVNNKFVAERARQALGIPDEVLKGLESAPNFGYAGTMKLLLKLGTMMGEHKFIDGSTGNAGGGLGGLDPTSAAARLEAHMADPVWNKRWREGGVEERKLKSDLIAIMAGGGR